jgi:hypothetical protein
MRGARHLFGSGAIVLGLALAAPAADAAPAGSTVRVSFVRGEQLVQVRRPGTTAADALRQLLAGPTRAESADAFRTYIPAGSRLRRLSIASGVATVDLNGSFASRRTDEQLLASVTQLVETLSAFSGVGGVRLLVGGKPVVRTVAGVALSGPITLQYLRTPNVPVSHPPPLKLGPPDPATKAAQRQLIRLGYLLAGDDDGRLGPTTGEAVLAFQKFEGLERTGSLDGATRAALPTATHPTPSTQGGAGKRAEILLDRQVALLIRDNRVVRTIAVSTGKPSTPTPPGSYRVYAKIPRWWSTPFREWLPWALPFVGGIAFHEFADVPAFPASHGCVRQSFAVARWTYDFAEIGMPVRVLARA